MQKRIILFLWLLLALSLASGSDFGTTGLIDTPTARMLNDGDLKLSFNSQKIANSTNLTYQATPWLETTFRYTIFNPSNPTRNTIYPDGLNDRSYAVKLKIFNEGKYLPQMALGIRDILGTGSWGAEYLVASKKLADIDFSIGLGWGRLAERDSLSNPLTLLSSKFDKRLDENDISGGMLGGKVRTSSFFSGEKIGVFGGLSYEIEKLHLTFMAEYNSDSYRRERRLGTIIESSPFSIGAKWSRSKKLTLGLSYQQKNQIGVYFSSTLGTKILDAWKKPNPFQSILDLDSSEIRVNKLNIDSWYDRLLYDLESSGILLRKAKISANKTQVNIEITNNRYSLAADAINRVIILSELHLPKSVRKLNIVINEEGFRIATLSYSRNLNNDFKFKDKYNNIQILNARTISDPTNITSYRKGFFAINADLSSRFQFFDPENPMRSQLFMKISSSSYLGRGWSIIGSYHLNILNNFSLHRMSNSVLPHVRSDINEYLVYGKSGIESLFFEKKSNITNDLYYRLYGGILEDMYAGIGSEFLYQPFRSRLAYGLTLNAVQKRDFKRNLKLQNYKTMTGFISLYYASSFYNYDFALHAGKYLAKDKGLTFEIRRTFDNGFSIGAFTTFTNVSAEDFGEGSFDKGLFFKIPFNRFSKNNIKRTFSTYVRSIQRDGGQKLNDFTGRLWFDLRNVRYDSLDNNKNRMILR